MSTSPRYVAWRRVKFSRRRTPGKILNLCLQADSVRGLSIDDIAEKMRPTPRHDVEKITREMIDAGLLWQVNKEVNRHAD